jgi:hypothetical protein
MACSLCTEHKYAYFVCLKENSNFIRKKLWTAYKHGRGSGSEKCKALFAVSAAVLVSATEQNIVAFMSYYPSGTKQCALSSKFCRLVTNGCDIVIKNIWILS